MLFGIIGGDRRQEELLALLRRDGYTVAACGVAGEMDWDAAVAAEVVILPLPLCKEGDTLNIEGPRRGVGALFRQFRRDQLILAGQVKPAQAALAAELDLKLVDYFRREELTVANAAATAEGTVQVILERLERSLLGSRCLVLGFGRIGKLLCHRLTAMGAHVTAAARRPESLAWAKAYGYETADIGRLEGNLGAFDVVVNTAPEPVFGADRLRELKPECLCVDVASVQGIDLSAAEALGLECIWARGLPGKLMPKTAGAVIRDTVYTIIKKQGGHFMRTERVGFALCGSFCTHEKALTALKRLTEEYETVIPIVSENAAFTDTRFGTSDALLEQLEELTGHEVLYDIPSVEPLGPKGMIDVLVIAPCTGNTLAKLAHGITDTTVTMAAKSHLRCGRPVVIAFSTNDGLSASAKNIGELLNRKHYYFVPFGQDDPEKKPTSLAADFELIEKTVEAALEGKQLQPLLLK